MAEEGLREESRHCFSLVFWVGAVAEFQTEIDDPVMRPESRSGCAGGDGGRERR